MIPPVGAAHPSVATPSASLGTWRLGLVRTWRLGLLVGGLALLTLGCGIQNDRVQPLTPTLLTAPAPPPPSTAPMSNTSISVQVSAVMTTAPTASPSPQPTAIVPAPQSPMATAVAPTAKPASTALSGTPILVYFSRRPESDADFGAVFPLHRTAPDQRVATAALEALIAGPTTDETATGYSSELAQMLRGPSSCDGANFRIALVDGTATVSFCRQITSAGIGQDARAQAQLNATLRQFATIRQVRLLTNDGRCLFDASGLNRC